MKSWIYLVCLVCALSTFSGCGPNKSTTVNPVADPQAKPEGDPI